MGRSATKRATASVATRAIRKAKRIPSGLRWRYDHYYPLWKHALQRFSVRAQLGRAQLPTISLTEVTGGVPNTNTEGLIFDEICLPPHYGPTDHDDFGPLVAILRALRPRTVIELGTARGNMAANVCRLLPDCRVYTVNAPAADQTGLITTFELRKDEIGEIYRRHGYGDRVTQIYANTLKLDLSSYLPEKSADLAIIDACHDTKYVMNDFRKVEPFVRDGGVVLFHDTHPSMRDHLVGSYVACLKIRRKGFDVRHLAGTWWAYWRKPETLNTSAMTQG